MLVTVSKRNSELRLSFGWRSELLTHWRSGFFQNWLEVIFLDCMEFSKILCWNFIPNGTLPFNFYTVIYSQNLENSNTKIKFNYNLKCFLLFFFCSYFELEITDSIPESPLNQNIRIYNFYFKSYSTIFGEKITCSAQI